jgi:hypothetical protein
MVERFRLRSIAGAFVTGCQAVQCRSRPSNRVARAVKDGAGRTETLHPFVLVRQTHGNFVIADVSPDLDKTLLRKVSVPRYVHFDHYLDRLERCLHLHWGAPER